MNWDDLRFVLAVARAGTALGASRALGVNQTTVMRRIAQVEEDLGASLFERSQSGFRLTATGVCVAQAAERVEAEVHALDCELSAKKRLLSGVVRLTTSETLANRLVAPCLASFQKQHPGVRIELIADDRRLDVARGAADVALRAGSRPEGAGIVMTKMPVTPWSVYCSRGYAAENGMPASREEIRHHAVVGMEGPMSRLPGPLWIEAAAPDADVRVRSNSLTNLASTLRAGLGVATLPCFIGDGEPDLIRCMPPPPELDSELWIIVREDLRAEPHVRAFTNALAAYIRSLRAQLGGAALEA